MLDLLTLQYYEAKVETLRSKEVKHIFKFQYLILRYSSLGFELLMHSGNGHKEPSGPRAIYTNQKQLYGDPLAEIVVHDVLLSPHPPWRTLYTKATIKSTGGP